MSKTTDDRYPYTYAALYIVKNFIPLGSEKVVDSGTGEAHFENLPTQFGISDADRILTGICRDADLDVRKVAETLATKYLRENAEA